jgi:hypothetical protein
MSYKSLGQSVGARMDLPTFPGRWSLRLGRCGLQLLLLIAFGYATVYIVRAVLSL